MTKSANKRKARKGSVRKTIGALFMATAVLVAAIPVNPLGAASSDLKVTVDVNNCRIPILPNDETVYTTGDGHFQFAYVSPNDISSSNKVAVILGYDGGYLEGGSLVIPDSVDAYLKYSDNMGTSYGYCAVSKNGNFLYYEEKVQKKDDNGNLVFQDTDDPLLDDKGQAVTDKEGKPLYKQEPVYDTFYRPCYYSDLTKWHDLQVDQFYYKTDDGEYHLTSTSDYQPIKGATVRYIGNQYLIAGTGMDAGTWKIGGIVETPEQGIFRGEKAGNIVSLTVGPELSGVGNYAFYGCSNLKSITLGNGLDTIGNYAFANCINMSSVNVDINAMITTIGDHAFYNCDALTSFTMPISVTRVGDYAFADCNGLKNVELCGNGSNVALNELGSNVFQNCSSLESLEFPQNFTAELEIGMFAGCSSLKFIRVNNSTLNFVDNKDGNFTIESFKNTVPKEFYFEGMMGSPLYKTASDHFIAFKYYNEDIYEIIVEDEAGRKALYQVNSQNQLQKCEIPEGMEKVEIPETVGPYKIQSIWGTSFRNNCYLKEIVIPSSVLEIQAGAFKGCHNLETVYFSEPIQVTSIGDEAFQTQDIGAADHKTNCPDTQLAEKPSLYFVGPIDAESAPFQYAMKEINKLNVSGQERAYITYCSGWPTNLQVEYDPNTGLSTLTGYPTFQQISNYNINSYPYMEEEYVAAATQAVSKYVSGEPMTDGEKEIINAALAIEVPYGVEAIRDGLFTENEAQEQYAVEKTLTVYGVKEIKPRTFKDCKNFTEIHIMDSAEKIGDNAFENCSNLTNVTLSNTVTEIGKTPFYGCERLNYVNFMNSPYFSCPSAQSSMIFQLDENGAPYKLLEVLPGRTNRRVAPEELQGIRELGEGAFKGTEVGDVDMTQSMITVIPSEAFAETGRLYMVDLPNNWTRIDEDAFLDSALQYLTLPGQYGNIDNNAFSGNTNSDGEMTFYCEVGGSAEGYAIQNGIKYENIEAKRYYNVKFFDFDGNLLKEESVLEGTPANPPEAPAREGYIFKNWTFDTENIQKDMEFKAYYEPDSEYNTVVVTFYDYDGTQIGEPYRVLIGSDMTHVPDPVREGYRFIGWSVPLTNVQTDLNPHALYEPLDGKFTVRFLDEDEKTVLYSVAVEPGEDSIMPVPPTKTGKTFVKWSPSPTNVTRDMDVIAIYEDARGQTNTPSGDGGSGSGSGSGGNQTTSQLYTLTVKNGLGTGSYVAGTPVVVKAQEAGSNQEFVNWTVDPADVTVTDKDVSAIIVTMPAANVTLTANFRAKSGSSGGNNNGSGTNKPSTNGGNPGTSGTTVVIDKNGLSNTGVVSAVVNGSSDNFTIKVREDANASELAMRALQAEYGDDLTGIKYFPMDISLYDSTGKNQITDTTGLSIRITLPLPDSLTAYAGNNKVASVSGGKLEKLQPSFTTISGVSCVTFTAEHFSPYVIYVDTRNLTAGSVLDSTPKTGDGIHPKWFLSIGLAFVSVFLFLKKDKQPKKVPVKVKTGVR